MRFALAAGVVVGLTLTGCIVEPPDSGPDYPPSGGSGWGSGWGGSGGTIDSCGTCGSGYVCARNGECTIASGVRIVHATWTMRDQVASPTTCSSAKYLDITFSTSSSGDQFGFAPVPCSAGKYTVDKMPLRFTLVTLARGGDYSGGATATFDTEGNAALDLPY